MSFPENISWPSLVTAAAKPFPLATARNDCRGTLAGEKGSEKVSGMTEDWQFQPFGAASNVATVSNVVRIEFVFIPGLLLLAVEPVFRSVGHARFLADMSGVAVGC